MKIAICLLLCLGAALADQYTRSVWPKWNIDRSLVMDAEEEHEKLRYGHEYTYIYNGQVMTGVPGTSKQHSGSRLRAKVRFVCKSVHTCFMQMEEVRMGKLNRRVRTPRQVLPFESFDPIPLEPEQWQRLHLAVKFSYNNGEITNLVFDARERPWSSNIKRGVLNLIQLKLKPQKERSSLDLVDQIEDDILNVYKASEDDAKFYRTMEETIEGKCEAVYTVTKPAEFRNSRQDIFNVTKTINFEKCVKRPQIKYNFHFTQPCPTCENKYVEDQKFLKSSSISSYQVIKAKRFNVIENAYTESEYVFAPFNEESNAIVTYVSQNMQLIRTGLATRRIQMSFVDQIKSTSDMIYNLDDEISREIFQMEGSQSALKKALHKIGHDKVQLAKNLLKKLLNNIQEQVHEPATKHFVELVNLLRLMPKIEIDRTHDMVERVFVGPEHKMAKDMLHDAMGSAGTKACVDHLVEKIRQRRLPIQKAVSAIKNLNTMRTPSREIIQQLIKLAESSVSERHYSLKQATWLTVGSLMNVLCSSTADQWALESRENIEKYCPKTLKEEYVKVLLRKLHSAHKWDDQLIYVKALGNAALDISVFELEKIINNRNFNYRKIIRVESILALRQLTHVMPRKIQKVLMPVVSNKMEPEGVRIAAAYMILKTLPKRPVLDQLAKLTHNERSMQVASFLDTYMRNLANTTNPCEKQLADNLKLSLRHSHKIFTRPANSKFLRVAMHSQKQRAGLDLDLTSVFANEEPIPRELAATVHSNFLGLWTNYLVSGRLTTESIEKVLARASGEFYGREWPTHLSEILGESKLFGKAGYENLVSPIDVLDIEHRDPLDKVPKAILALKMKNQDVGFWSIKRETIESVLRFGRPTGMAYQIEQQLRQGMEINYNKAAMLDEITFSVPTTIGMPVIAHINVPAVVNVHGVVKLTPSFGDNLGALQVKAVLKPSLVASVSVAVQAWTPVIATGVQVVSKIKAFQPIDAKVQLNLKDQTKTVRVLFKPPTHKKDLITLESKPSTFTLVQPKQKMHMQDRQKRLILGEEGNRVRSIHTCNSYPLFGTHVCIQGRYHKTPEHRLTESTFIPLSGPNKVVLSVRPTFDRPQTVAINVYGKALEPTIGGSIESTSELFGGLWKSLQSTYLQPELETFENQMEDDDVLIRKVIRDNKVNPINKLVSDKNSKRPLKNSIRVEVQTPNRKATFDLVHIFNFDGDFHKVHAKLVKSPTPEHPQPWKMCLNAETIMPTIKNIRHLHNQQVIGKMLLNWGTSCSSPNFIHAIKRLEKGQHSRLQELQNPEWHVHRDASLKHDQLLQKSPIKYVFEIKYNNVPLKSKHYLNEIMRFAKKRHYDQTKVAEVAVHNRPQHVKIIVAVDPITLKKCDVLVKTPRSNMLIRDMYLPPYASPITHRMDYLKNEERSLTRENLIHPTNVQCYASEYTLKTFHDRELPMPQSHSYKVLAKDCSNNRYTVLVRKLSERKNLKEVKIVTPEHTITLKPSTLRSDKMKVFVNGRDYTQKSHVIKTQAGIPTLKIVKHTSHVKVEILTAGISIFFDRKSINVEVPPQMKHNQCGMCSSGSLSTLRRQFSTPYLMRDQEIEREWESEREFASPVTRFERENELSKILTEENSFERLSNQLRDYSTFEQDGMEYYFGVPAFNTPDRMWGRESEIFEEYADQAVLGMPWTDIERTQKMYLMDEQDSLESFSQQGWTRPAERLWELEQKTSNQDRKFNLFEEQPEFFELEREFGQLYTPLDEMERSIDRELMRESWSWTPAAFETLSEEDYSLNPYLSRNFLVNDRACQYMPFWRRQLAGCQEEQEMLFERFERPSQFRSSWNTEELIAQEIDREIRHPESRLIDEQERVFGGIFGQEFEEETFDEIRREERQIMRQQELLQGEYEPFTIRPELVLEENAWTQSEMGSGRKQKYIETEHSICFSTRPVQCPEGTEPTGEKYTNVPYHCMSRKNPLAEKFLNELTSGRRTEPQLLALTPTMSRREVVATSCTPRF